MKTRSAKTLIVRSPLLVLTIIFSVAITLFGQAKEMRLRFSVLDERNEPFRDLKASDISVTVKKKPVQPKSLNAVNDVPMNVLILVDASASQEKMLPIEKRIAEYFIDNVLKSGSDNVGIAKFTGKVDFLYGPGPDFAMAKSKLKEIEFEPPTGYLGGGVVVSRTPRNINKDQMQAGSTSIFDTIIKGASTLDAVEGQGTRKAILLLSDGANTYGKKKLKDAVDAAIRTGVTIFAMGLGDEPYNGVDETSLKKLTLPTGGLTVVPNKKFSNADALMNRLKNALLSRYEVTFTTVPDNGAGLSDTSVEITNPQLKSRNLQIFQPRAVLISK